MVLQILHDPWYVIARFFNASAYRVAGGCSARAANQAARCYWAPRPSGHTATRTRDTRPACGCSDAIADLRAAVGRDAAFDLALVVVDEQAGGHEILEALLQQLELEGGRDGVGGAGADLPLVVDGGTAGAQVG